MYYMKTYCSSYYLPVSPPVGAEGQQVVQKPLAPPVREWTHLLLLGPASLFLALVAAAPTIVIITDIIGITAATAAAAAAVAAASAIAVAVLVAPALLATAPTTAVATARPSSPTATTRVRFSPVAPVDTGPITAAAASRNKYTETSSSAHTRYFLLARLRQKKGLGRPHKKSSLNTDLIPRKLHGS